MKREGSYFRPPIHCRTEGSTQQWKNEYKTTSSYWCRIFTGFPPYQRKYSTNMKVLFSFIFPLLWYPAHMVVYGKNWYGINANLPLSSSTVSYVIKDEQLY